MTVSWPYARRSKHDTKRVKNPHAHRFVLEEGIYVPYSPLPDKWKLRLNEENIEAVCKWRTCGAFSLPGREAYILSLYRESRGYHISEEHEWEIKDEYETITDEMFFTYVLNK